MESGQVDLSDASVLVTGGAGFIGSHLAEYLVDRGAAVTVLDDLSAGDRRNLDAVADAVEFVEGDVRDRETVSTATAGQDLVFHLAANAHVPTSVEEPRHDFEVNATGTQAVLKAGVDADVDRIVLASSAAVYGPPQSVPIAESHPLDPVSPYGASKLAAEKLGFAYGETYDIDVSALRIFNTYGPRQPRYVMYDFFRKLEADPSELAMLGSGEQVRTFVYVSDTVAALVALGTHPDAVGRPFNVGGTEPTSIRELAELMAERFYDGEPNVRATGDPKAGDIERLVTDNSRIRELGVEPTVPLETGLDRLYEWFVDTEV
ncbi:SDR family NAD(P)-dependent oxidoreductase [Halapricum sp. CBA1109]|uniref:NAD-dependent epimerase/dehydratase family protein n=1 Tax=Halapricum sp. CBA1109 TaxID=2668068 RepID=UPI0012F9F186|nr:NAD-dependent epimerase/dehydratase family protein [Halapricum sp. CBA1109]MUV88837.1 SDR family NAD(P)-dependent oxidoreductase [Halapricum sp. CBA1109]